MDLDSNTMIYILRSFKKPQWQLKFQKNTFQTQKKNTCAKNTKSILNED